MTALRLGVNALFYLPGDVGGSETYLRETLRALARRPDRPDLVLFFKYMMVLKGDKEYTLHFNADDQLSDSQRGYVETQLKLFDTWYAEWSKLPGAVQTYKA